MNPDITKETSFKNEFIFIAKLELTFNFIIGMEQKYNSCDIYITGEKIIIEKLNNKFLLKGVTKL